MPSQVTHNIDLANIDLDRIQAALAGLERPKRVTLKSIVESQRDAILAARRRGMRYDEIASAISTAGCPIAPATLRKYVGPTTLRPVAAPAPTTSRPPTPPAVESRLTTRRSLRRSTYLVSDPIISLEKTDV